MKKLVKEAVKDSAFKYLTNNKETMSKMKDLKYSELKMQEYLSVQNINNRHKKLAFKIRSNMLPMLNNLGQKAICLVCQKTNSEDNQKHALLNCDGIKKLVPDIASNTQCNYMDIFSDNVDDIKKTVELCDKSIINTAMTKCYVPDDIFRKWIKYILYGIKTSIS